MDNETEELVLCIQLQDLEDSLSQSKGKQREDAMTDGQLAFILAKEDLQRTLQLLRDRRMGRSLSRACETDQGLITTLNLQEDAARQDHATAQSLSGQAARPLAIMPGSPRVDIDDASLQRFAAMNEDAGSSGLTSILSGIQSFGFVEDEEETNQASSSSVQRKGNLRKPSVECPICTNAVDASDVYQLPC